MTEVPLRVAFTPDPDDAFDWWAIATGRLAIPGRVATFAMHPIHAINVACGIGKFDVASISSAAYPALARDYVILSAGASVGRGYGPALAVRRDDPPRDPSRSLVAIPGDTTTGAMLLRLFFPGVRTVSVPGDEIATAVILGDVDAGVLIHEELLNCEVRELRRLLCLGAAWTDLTGLPIPVGVTVARRSLGMPLLQEIAQALRDSVATGLSEASDAIAWAMQFTHQAGEGIGRRYIEMFSNDDAVDLADDCLVALTTLYELSVRAGLIHRVPPLDLVRAPRRSLEAHRIGALRPAANAA